MKKIAVSTLNHATAISSQLRITVFYGYAIEPRWARLYYNVLNKQESMVISGYFDFTHNILSSLLCLTINSLAIKALC